MNKVTKEKLEEYRNLMEEFNSKQNSEVNTRLQDYINKRIEEWKGIVNNNGNR